MAHQSEPGEQTGLRAHEASSSARPKLAVITGASSGIGAATATALAERGWRVVLVARRRAELDAVADGIGKRAGAVTVEALDASSGEAVAQMAERVRMTHGVPDLVVNAAGAGDWKFIEETSPAEARAMLDAPFFAAFNVTQAFVGDMLLRKSGVIVHVGSPAAFFAWPGATGYTASRWALRGFHEALCQDLRHTGVRSCHVAFGLVDTPYFRHNPTTAARMPRVTRLLRTLRPPECGDIIARIAERPVRDYRHPGMLRALFVVAAVFPGLIRWVLAITGAKRG